MSKKHGRKLFDEDSSGAEDNDGKETHNRSINVNKEYAKKYAERKQNEELSILKDKYKGEDPEKLLKKLEKGQHVHRGKSVGFADKDAKRNDDESSTDTEEDEFGEELTPEVDVQIFRTIAAIRSKSKDAFDPNINFFSDEKLAELRSKAPKVGIQKETNKPYSIKDYHRETLLSGQVPGALPDRHVKTREMTHVEEQEILKSEFKRAAFDAEETDSGDDDGILQLREKSNEEEEQNEKAYKKWLLENLKEQETSVAFKDWVDYQENKQTSIDSKERFLMDYVLNRGWIDKDEAKSNVPSYDELIASDEEEVKKAEEFETKYNFRFEEMEAIEPGSSYNSNLYGIVSHTRDIKDSARRKDNRRAEERARRKDREEQEKLQKMEELKRLKNLKKTEIFERLKKVKEISGISNEDQLEELLDGVDLDGDFDPDIWDTKMQETFNNNYYGEQVESVKPKFTDDLEDIDLLLDKKSDKLAAKKLKSKDINLDEFEFGACGDDEEEDDFIMDADYIPGGEHYQEEQQVEEQSEEDEESEKEDKIQKYLDEYYQLDYEDMIGDQPTRFKYHKVEKDDFGLKANEILDADDKELNEYLSLKKLAPYRMTERDKMWMQKWKKASRKRRKELRKKLKQLKSKVQDPQNDSKSNVNEQQPTEESKKKRKRKRNSSKKDAEISDEGKKEPEPAISENPNDNGVSEKKSKREHKHLDLDKTRLAAYSVPSKSKKQKVK